MNRRAFLAGATGALLVGHPASVAAPDEIVAGLSAGGDYAWCRLTTYRSGYVDLVDDSGHQAGRCWSPRIELENLLVRHPGGDEWSVKDGALNLWRAGVRTPRGSNGRLNAIYLPSGAGLA